MSFKNDVVDLVVLLKELDLLHETKLRKDIKSYLKNSGLLDLVLRVPLEIENSNSISERLYCILHNFKGTPLCLECNKNKVKFYDYIKGYSPYCSSKCSFHSPDVTNKRKKTTIQNYGVENIFLKREYIIENNIKKFGVSNLNQLERVKEKKKRTFEEKYGVGITTNLIAQKEQIKKTILDKYGVNNVSQNKSIKEKIKQKNLNKTNTEKREIQEKREKTSLLIWGTTNPSKCENIKQKIKTTWTKNYGGHPQKEFQVKNKMILKNNEKYGVPYSIMSNDVKQKIRLTQIEKMWSDYKKYLDNYSLEVEGLTKESFIRLLDNKHSEVIFKCKKCKTIFKDIVLRDYNFLNKCRVCYPKHVSKTEEEISQYLSQYNITRKDRSILDGKELDIYLPQHKLAIEYNGLMFHSIGKSKYSMFNNSDFESQLKDCHLDKTERCVQQGIQLLHIFENEWLNPQKQEVWKSIIKSKLHLNDRVYARSLVIQSVSYGESCDFLDNNHLQGQDKSSIRLGLYNKEGDLLSLMTFGRSRYDKKVTWELLRFASKKDLTVVGGASKLFKYFKNNYLQPGESIVSYADRRHSNGNLYEKLGFTLSHISSPNYFYFKENSLIFESRLGYQKHKLKDKLPVFDENLTESENMYNNGYRKVYDSGNLVYMLVKE